MASLQSTEDARRGFSGEGLTHTLGRRAAYVYWRVLDIG
jgi:hypothetical protein